MNFDFVKPEVYYEGEIEAFKPFKLYIEPLPKEFGETLANALRRVLLSYIPGAACVGFKIPNVIHEMQEIPNASTDTIQLVGNLKATRFQIEQETQEVKIVELKVSKPGIVYAKDLILPKDVTVMNPEQEILIYNEDEELHAFFYIQKGYGSKEKKEIEGLPEEEGVIAVDAIYSPIKTVGYEVKTARVGDEAKYDKIEFFIKSDGSVHPKEAVELAIHLMNSFFSLFLDMSDITEKTKLYKEKKEEQDRLMNTPIELLGLTQRSYNALKNANMNFVKDLAEIDKKALGAINQLGKKSVDEIIDNLAEKGIHIPD